MPQLEREGRQFDDRAAFEGGLVRAQAHAGPVGRLHGVRERIAILDQRHGELVRQVRMAAAVAAALREAQVRLLARVIDALRRVFRDALGQAPGEVGALDRLGNLRLGQLGRVQDERLVLDQRPLDGFLRAIDVNALAILPRRVEEAADDARADVAAVELDVRGLDGERRAVALDEFLADGAASRSSSRIPPACR